MHKLSTLYKCFGCVGLWRMSMGDVFIRFPAMACFYRTSNSRGNRSPQLSGTTNNLSLDLLTRTKSKNVHHLQRLEAPECAPKEYYSLMLKCWEHNASKRPKFSEIYTMLPDMKPEQLKTVVGSTEPAKKEFLFYRQNEIITVLDKCTNSPYWKGVLNSGKTGLFNPANTVTYLGSLPSSSNRDSFCRSSDRSSKRKLRTEMISRPQNDLKHTGHVGLDGAYFGDIAFMSSVQNVSFCLF